MHEDRKQDMMSQYEREVVTMDQIGLQQKWCRDMKSCRDTEFSKRKGN